MRFFRLRQKTVIIARAHPQSAAVAAEGHSGHQYKVKLLRLQQLRRLADTADAVTVKLKVQHVLQLYRSPSP